jgi:hypothetical protein
MSESNQWQCPNCGGYKISATTTKFVMQNVPIPTNKRVNMGIMGSILIVASISIYFINFSDGFVMSVWFGLIGLILLAQAFLRTSLKEKVGDSYRFTCSLCGYNWDWSRGQPVPKAKVNPDLIAKGAQKLEQEEQRRKQQEDAEALYHLTHKK